MEIGINIPNPELIRQQYDEYEFQAQYGDYKVLFNDASLTYSHLFAVKKENTLLRFMLDGAAAQSTILSNNVLLYPSIFDGVDLRYSILKDKIKEEFIIRNSSSKKSFAFHVLEDGITSVFNDDGSITYYEALQNEIYAIEAPFAYDDNNNELEVTVSYSGGSYTLEVKTDSNTVYPITLDPTVSIPSADSWGMSLTASASAYPTSSKTIDIVAKGKPEVKYTSLTFTTNYTYTVGKDYCDAVFLDNAGTQIGSKIQIGHNSIYTFTVPDGAVKITFTMENYNYNGSSSRTIYAYITSASISGGNIASVLSNSVKVPLSFSSVTSWMPFYNSQTANATDFSILRAGMVAGQTYDFTYMYDSGDESLLVAKTVNYFPQETWTFLNKTASYILFTFYDDSGNIIITETLTNCKDATNYSVTVPAYAKCASVKYHFECITTTTGNSTIGPYNFFEYSFTSRNSISKASFVSDGDYTNVELWPILAFNNAPNYTLKWSVNGSMISSGIVPQINNGDIVQVWIYTDTLTGSYNIMLGLGIFNSHITVAFSFSIDLTRVICTSNQFSTDLIRKVTATSVVNSDVSRSVIANNRPSVDTTRKVAVNNSFRIDTARSAIVTFQNNSDLIRKVTADISVLSDVCRAVQSVINFNIDINRKVVSSINYRYDTLRKALQSFVLDSDTQRSIVAYYNFNFDSARIIQRQNSFRIDLERKVSNTINFRADASRFIIRTINNVYDLRRNVVVNIDLTYDTLRKVVSNISFSADTERIIRNYFNNSFSIDTERKVVANINIDADTERILISNFEDCKGYKTQMTFMIGEDNVLRAVQTKIN